MSSKPRTVIITGANKGIGYHLTEALLTFETPYHIILAARSQENGEKALDQLKTTHPNTSSKITVRQLDIDDTTSVQAFIDWIKADLGTYDVLVNNAAIGHFPEDTQQKINTIKTNFINTVLFTEKLLPYLAADGKVLEVSSTLGSLSFQSKKARALLENPNNTTEKLLDIANRLIQYVEQGKDIDELGFVNSGYNATKSLLNAYTRFVLPQKVKSGQQVYSVCPGWCRTDMGGSNAAKSAEEGADTLAYLISLPFKVDQNLHGKFIREREVIAWDDTTVPEVLAKVVDY